MRVVVGGCREFFGGENFVVVVRGTFDGDVAGESADDGVVFVDIEVDYYPEDERENQVDLLQVDFEHDAVDSPQGEDEVEGVEYQPQPIEVDVVGVGELLFESCVVFGYLYLCPDQEVSAVGYGENHVGVVDDGAFGDDVECGQKYEGCFVGYEFAQVC